MGSPGSKATPKASPAALAAAQAILTRAARRILAAEAVKR